LTRRLVHEAAGVDALRQAVRQCNPTFRVSPHSFAATPGPETREGQIVADTLLD
jgi:hypothetical protein